jgi:hypothetical protein
MLNDMHSTFLVLHSALRWIALALGLWAFAAAVSGVNGRRQWLPSDEAKGKFFVMSLDIQLLIGLALYFVLGPYFTLGMGDVAGSMRAPQIRFFFVEHPVGMIVAIALAHVGRVKSRRVGDALQRHKAAAVFFGLALAIMLLSTPWPFSPGARELFRWFE